MRHPVELVLQVVARACWSLESTASRPKINTVRRSCVHSCCGLIDVDLVMEPPAQPCPGYSGGSCSVILAAGHHGLAQSRQDLLENGSTFLGPKVGAPLCDELDGAARGTRGSMGVRACLEKRAVSRGAAWAFKSLTLKRMW